MKSAPRFYSVSLNAENFLRNRGGHFCSAGARVNADPALKKHDPLLRATRLRAAKVAGVQNTYIIVCVIVLQKGLFWEIEERLNQITISFGLVQHLHSG